ncbi:MAG TPA: hypothetical protein VM681_03790 [Candidatus Thermoplasmatota archaeon]|nr:hypothetical protein [Candidatus Thermoplasmatota archaeon]
MSGVTRSAAVLIVLATLPLGAFETDAGAHAPVRALSFQDLLEPLDASVVRLWGSHAWTLDTAELPDGGTTMLRTVSEGPVQGASILTDDVEYISFYARAIPQTPSVGAGWLSVRIDGERADTVNLLAWPSAWVPFTLRLGGGIHAVEWTVSGRSGGVAFEIELVGPSNRAPPSQVAPLSMHWPEIPARVEFVCRVPDLVVRIRDVADLGLARVEAFLDGEALRGLSFGAGTRTANGVMGTYRVGWLHEGLLVIPLGNLPPDRDVPFRLTVRDVTGEARLDFGTILRFKDTMSVHVDLRNRQPDPNLRGNVVFDWFNSADGYMYERKPRMVSTLRGCIDGATIDWFVDGSIVPGSATQAIAQFTTIGRDAQGLVVTLWSPTELAAEYLFGTLDYGSAHRVEARWLLSNGEDRSAKVEFVEGLDVRHIRLAPSELPRAWLFGLRLPQGPGWGYGVSIAGCSPYLGHVAPRLETPDLNLIVPGDGWVELLAEHAPHRLEVVAGIPILQANQVYAPSNDDRFTSFYQLNARLHIRTFADPDASETPLSERALRYFGQLVEAAVRSGSSDAATV